MRQIYQVGIILRKLKFCYEIDFYCEKLYYYKVPWFTTA